MQLHLNIIIYTRSVRKHVKDQKYRKISRQKWYPDYSTTSIIARFVQFSVSSLDRAIIEVILYEFNTIPISVSRIYVKITKSMLKIYVNLTIPISASRSDDPAAVPWYLYLPLHLHPHHHDTDPEVPVPDFWGFVQLQVSHVFTPGQQGYAPARCSAGGV